MIMRINKSILIIIGLLFLLPSLGQAIEVHFKSQAQVTGQRITLGEIAKINPEAAERKFSEERLFRAPRAGQTKVYKTKVLKAYVLQALPRGITIKWSGSEKIIVRRKGILITQEKLKNVINSYLEEKRKDFPKIDLHFIANNFPDPFTVPTGKMSYEVIPGQPDIIGSHHLTVLFEIDGQVVKNVTIRGKLKAIAPVITAIKDLSRGAVINKKDVRQKKCELAKLRDPCFRIASVIGKRLKRKIDSGEVIEQHDLTLPIMVNRGQLVTMVAKKGPLEIRAKGVACSNGKQGEVIKVRNTNSQREIFCKVTGSGQVLVEF